MEADEERASEEELEQLGYYSLADGAKLFDAFEAAAIDYGADLVDSNGAITPALSRMGGAFGNAVRVLISIDPRRREDVQRIHSELFGDCLPNYESSFFKEQHNLDRSSDDTPKT